MGFDPPGLGEVYEVCIVLEGPVDPQAFKEFEKELKKCLKDHLGAIDDPTLSPTGKLQVKKRKAEVRIK
ncbi:MAG TPA: hypothetical protein VNN07_18065 [Candidatus Tectomicrobia bacterium]|nr:hypothetical protein [Candidatus Tectomicrobia bacterium]